MWWLLPICPLVVLGCAYYFAPPCSDPAPGDYYKAHGLPERWPADVVERLRRRGKYDDYARIVNQVFGKHQS